MFSTMALITCLHMLGVIWFVYGVMLLGTMTLTALSGCVSCHVGYNGTNCMPQYVQYYLVVYGLMWGTIALTAIYGCVSCHV